MSSLYYFHIVQYTGAKVTPKAMFFKQTNFLTLASHFLAIIFEITQKHPQPSMHPNLLSASYCQRKEKQTMWYTEQELGLIPSSSNSSVWKGLTGDIKEATALISSWRNGVISNELHKFVIIFLISLPGRPSFFFSVPHWITKFIMGVQWSCRKCKQIINTTGINQACFAQCNRDTVTATLSWQIFWRDLTCWLPSC